jgi:hypothetical protein
LDRRRHLTCGSTILNGDIEAEPTSGRDDFDQEAAVARLLARRRKKADQLFRFREKQQRQRRWIPLRAAIDWLASFNSHGERTAFDDSKAMLFAAEIWNAFCGKDIFTNFRLGSSELPWCIIEDGHQDHAISRFRRGDLLLGASNDKKMMLALIKRLWVPRVPLLNLFQEKRWPLAPWLRPAGDQVRDEGSPREEPIIPARQRLSFAQQREIFQRWRDGCSHIPSEDEDCDAMFQHGIRRAAVRKLRLHFPTKRRGRPKI